MISKFTEVGILIFSKSIWFIAVLEFFVLVVIFSRFWACCKRRWFRRRFSRRSVRMVSTWFCL